MLLLSYIIDFKIGCLLSLSFVSSPHAFSSPSSSCFGPVFYTLFRFFFAEYVHQLHHVLLLNSVEVISQKLGHLLDAQMLQELLD